MAMAKYSNSFNFTAYGDSIGQETGKLVVSQLLEAGRKLAIIDVDDTLRCTDGRKKYLPSTEEILAETKYPNRAFDRFNSMAAGDPLIRANFHIVKGLEDCGYIPLLLTSCTYSLKNKDVLMTQMKIGGLSYSNYILAMRGEDNQETPLQMKVEFLETTGILGHPLIKNIIAIDDNKEICREFTKLGIHTLNFLK